MAYGTSKKKPPNYIWRLSAGLFVSRNNVYLWIKKSRLNDFAEYQNEINRLTEIEQPMLRIPVQIKLNFERVQLPFRIPTILLN